MKDLSTITNSLECCARRKDKDACDQCAYFSGCQTENGAFAELASDAIRLLKRYDDALRMMVNQYCTIEGTDGDYFHNRCMSAGEYAFSLLGIQNCQRVPDDWLDDVGPHPDRKEIQNDD